MAVVKVLVVGGGGGGGSLGGGGGAGEYYYDPSHTVTEQAYSITVGSGGAGRALNNNTAGGNGGNSVFDTITAHGGGGGGGNNQDGSSGGSGGGSGPVATGSSGGTSTAAGSGLGNRGGGCTLPSRVACGGGGSASAGANNAGSDLEAAGSNGGNGTANSISGASVTYAGGGGGGGMSGSGGTNFSGGSGGTGGGGNGSSADGTTAAVAGTANRGSGGGGGGYWSGTGQASAAGGSGVVIVSYVTANFGTCTGGTITTDGANTVHTFTSSGTFTVVLPKNPFGQTDWPVPVRQRRDGNRYTGIQHGLNLPQYFYIPPPPFRQLDWPLPVRRRIGKPSLYSITHGINIPLMADYFYGLVYVSVNGIKRATGKSGTGMIEQTSFSIQDTLNNVPNTCTFQAKGFTPVVGQEVIVTLGSATLQNPNRLFAGTIREVNQSFVGTPDVPVYDVSCIDWTWQLSNRVVVKEYTNMTAGAIAADLMSSYAPSGFTWNNIDCSEVIDQISFDSNNKLPSALSQLAKRVGGYWYVDYNKNLYFFTASPVPSPSPLVPGHPTLNNESFTSRRDISQWITRAYSEGGGASVATNVAAGTTTLPVDDVSQWYQGAGGTVACGHNRITYAGIAAATIGGSLVGPGASPSASPGAANAIGTGIDAGSHGYAVTFVTGAGESIPGPVRTVSSYTMSAPSAPTVIVTADGTGGYVNAGSHDYVVTFLSSGGTETIASARTTVTVGSTDRVSLESLPLGDANCIGRRIYRTAANNPGGTLGKIFTINDNITRSFDDTWTDADIGFAPPASTTAIFQKINLTGIPIGGASVTQRKVYRTVAGGSTLKLLTTLADNTTTTYPDTTADASLGATAPASDTSGLSQASGQIIAGSTTLLCAGTGWASSSGGWAVIGNGAQVISYTGITGSSLTGIPATGAGAITATISYNSTITGCPMLTGIPASGAGAIAYAIKKGEQANILVRADDLSGQAALAALIGGDGIIEDYQQDGRIAYDECVARAEARLSLQSNIAVSIRWSSRDPLTASGASIYVDQPSPTSVTGTFTIQQVTISNFSENPNLFPTYTAEASNIRYTFEDLLRQARHVT